MPEPEDKPGEAVVLAADSLGHDILEALLGEVKQHLAWDTLPVAQQHLIIERLRQRTRYVVTEGLMMLFRGQYPACEATLEDIRIKRGLQVKLKIAKGATNWHEIVEAEGQRVLIVMADPETYLALMDEIKAAANQRDLFTGDYKGQQNGYRRDEPAPPIDQSCKDLIDSLEQPPDEGELKFGGAAEEPAPPPKSMGQQVHEFLAKVHVNLPIETCEAWSEQECTVAAFWAIEYAKDPDKAPARPHWLPMPDPIQSEQETDEEARIDVLDAADEADAQDDDPTEPEDEDEDADATTES